MPSPSGPFPAVLCPSIGRPGGTGVGRLVVGLLRLGYCLPFLGTPHVPLFPSQCLLPAPSPSQGLCREYLLGLGCQGCSGACSTPFSRLLQPSVRGVVDLEVMTFGRHPLPYPSLCGRVTLSVGVHSVCALSVSQGPDWPPSISGKRTFQWRFICFLSLSSLLVP